MEAEELPQPMRARKRSSERMAMALVRRTATWGGVSGVGGEGERGGGRGEGIERTLEDTAEGEEEGCHFGGGGCGCGECQGWMVLVVGGVTTFVV